MIPKCGLSFEAVRPLEVIRIPILNSSYLLPNFVILGVLPLGLLSLQVIQISQGLQVIVEGFSHVVLARLAVQKFLEFLISIAIFLKLKLSVFS